MKGHSCQGHQLHSWDISLAQLARQLLCESLLALSTRLLRAWVGCGNPPVVPRPHMRQRSRRLSEKKDGTKVPVDMKASLATHGRLNSSLGFWKRYCWFVSPCWKKERGYLIPGKTALMKNWYFVSMAESGVSKKSLRAGLCFKRPKITSIRQWKRSMFGVGFLSF